MHVAERDGVGKEVSEEVREQVWDQALANGCTGSPNTTEGEEGKTLCLRPNALSSIVSMSKCPGRSCVPILVNQGE